MRSQPNAYFFSGVSQISLSTPGVFLPLVSVTRRTARTLPLYEWVSRRCRARTLPHLLAFVACTIRTWSRRTLRLMARQSMAYHSAASRETNQQLALSSSALPHEPINQVLSCEAP